MAEATHNQELAAAFDGQARLFERAPVQTDPRALARLAERAGFPRGWRVLDCGCGPGLVALELLKGGVELVGVDLSHEMIERARKRCKPFGISATFHVGSVFDGSIAALGPFDGAISRFVLHHIQDPPTFIKRQAELIRPGGAVVLCDHTADPDEKFRLWHQEIERLRDKTHTTNLSPGAIVDLFVSAGLVDVSMTESAFTLDFDEWFDRGTPAVSKEQCRAKLLSGSAISFTPSLREGGGISIAARHAIVRGIKPGV
jgi:ubiquinone/menaquinone biosynthesis C-methylase UbiE